MPVQRGASACSMPNKSMTAAQHAEVMRKRIQHRRMVEEAKELKKADSWQFDKR